MLRPGSVTVAAALRRRSFAPGSTITRTAIGVAAQRSGRRRHEMHGFGLGGARGDTAHALDPRPPVGPGDDQDI